MSACISREGEYSDHTEGDEAFVCGRCGAEDWTAAMAEIERRTEQRDKAERRHERLESAIERLALDGERRWGKFYPHSAQLRALLPEVDS